MLSDTKNYGTIISNKTHRDFNTKKVIKNPESEWIYFENAVPPIYSKEIYDKTMEIMEKKVDKSGLRGLKVGSSPFSGKIYCSECGRLYWKVERKKTATRKKIPTGEKEIFWSCSTYCEHGRKKLRADRVNDLGLRAEDVGCDSPNVKEALIYSVLQNIGADLVVNKDVIKKDMLEWLNALIERLNTSNANKATLDEMKKQEMRKSKLTEAYMDGIISKEDYKVKYAELEATISRLKAEISVDDNREDIQEIKSVIANIDSEIDRYIASEDFASSRVEFLIDHIERITVSGAHFIIELDLLAGAILAGENFFQYVQGSRHKFIHTEKQYFIMVNGEEMPVLLKIA